MGSNLQIVAESGSLHRGDLEAAIEAVDAAVVAGADSFKLIMSNPEELIADKSLKFGNEYLYDVIDSYRLSDDEWQEIGVYCKSKKIDFYCSIGTPDYVRLAVEIGCSKLKSGAWDMRNYYLFDAMLETGLPLQFDISCVIVGEVDNLVHYIKTRNPDVELSFLYESHGDLNLKSIPFLKHRYNVSVGFSSEGRDSLPDLLAIMNGAEIIEKRLTPFADGAGHHQDKALAPAEFARWVKEMRNLPVNQDGWPLGCDVNEAQKMVGRYGLYPSLEDVQQKQLWLTSLVYDKDLKAGEVITRQDLAARRPGQGISPYYDYIWIGRQLKRDVPRNKICEFDDV